MKNTRCFMMMLLTLFSVGMIGCEIAATTPEQEEQREFDRTMEEVDAPESLRESSDRNVSEFESVY